MQALLNAFRRILIKAFTGFDAQLVFFIQFADHIVGVCASAQIREQVVADMTEGVHTAKVCGAEGTQHGVTQAETIMQDTVHILTGCIAVFHDVHGLPHNGKLNAVAHEAFDLPIDQDGLFAHALKEIIQPLCGIIAGDVGADDLNQRNDMCGCPPVGADEALIVDLLRQRSRPYLFSNTLAPAICAATIQTIDLLEESTVLRDKVHENAAYFRAGMEKLGFELLPGEHPIVPVMLYDPKVAHEFARRMLDKGVYVVAFCYPVVPKGKDRIRTQISAGHTKEDLDFAIKCFGEVKAEMGL